MNPFILQFAEDNSLEDTEPLLLNYSEELNLNVITDTNTPAINLITEELETFTKAGKESTDFDNAKQLSNLSINTFTRTKETTDPHQKILHII